NSFVVNTDLPNGNGPFFNIYNNNRVTIGTTTASYAMLNVSGTSTVVSTIATRKFGQVLADTLNQRFSFLGEDFQSVMQSLTTNDNFLIDINGEYAKWGFERSAACNISQSAPGVLIMASTGANSQCIFFLAGGGSASATSSDSFSPSTNPIFEMSVLPSSITDAAGEVILGFGDYVTNQSVIVATVDQVGFTTCTDTSQTCTSTTWRMYACKAGSCTFADSAKSASITAYSKLRAEVHTRRVDYYVNDIYVGNISTNVPTHNMGLFINYFADSGVNIKADYIRTWVDPPTAENSDVAILPQPQDPQKVLRDSSDLAEYYPSVGNDEIEPGYLVGVATSSEVQLTTQTYQSSLLGVVSRDPRYELGRGTGQKPYNKIALTGRVPVKVSLEGGSVRVGDLLTSSSISGYAMRARKPGRTAGMALESFDGISGNITMKQLPNGDLIATGEVLMFIDLGWSHLDSQVASIATSTEPWTVNLATGKLNTSYALNLGGQSIENVKSIVSASGNWSISENGDLIVKSIKADDITTKNLEVTQTGVTIHDTANNSPYCVQVVNGTLTTIPGNCVDNATPPPVKHQMFDTTPTPIPTPTPEVISTPPTPPEADVGADIIPTPTPEPTQPPATGVDSGITAEPVPPPIDQPPQA
ncbi:MAG: hypothetical protein AAB482_04750, partial [Patescibacteria group bacterium]